MEFLLLLAVVFPPDMRGIAEIATAKAIILRMTDPTTPDETTVPVPDDAEGKCDRCGGSGRIRHGDGHTTLCPVCDGTGKGSPPPPPPAPPAPKPSRVVVTLPGGEQVTLDEAPQVGETVGDWQLVRLDGTRAFWRRKAKEVEVLVFSATWCGPCRRYRDVWSRSGLPVREVDIDKFPDLSRKYGVTRVPTTVVLRHGREVARREGALTLSQLRALVPLPGQNIPGREHQSR